MKAASVFLFLLLVVPSLAQYDGKEPDVASRHRPGIMWYNTGWRPAKENSGPKYDRFMIDLTYNDWVNDSALFLVKPPSLGYNIHGMWDIPLAAGNAFGLGIGLSYRYQRVRYNGEMIRDEANRATLWQLYADGQGPEKSLFASHAFAIPLELRFRVPKWRQVKLHLGAHAGYRVRTFTKVRTDNEQDVKDRNFFDNAPFFCGLHARIGVRNWALYADYSLTKQFSSDKSTSLHPIAFGITCSFF